MRLFQYSILLLFCFAFLDASATRKLTTSIKFDTHSEEINLTNEGSLRALINSAGKDLIEKIDIIGTCTQQTGVEGHYDLTCKRTESVYAEMIGILPDVGQYEVQINHLMHKGIPSTEELVDEVQIVMYLLKRNVEAPSIAIEKALFPEEFDELLEYHGSPIAKEEIIDVEDNNYTFIPSQVSAGSNFKLKNIFFYGNSALYKKDSNESLAELLHFMTNTDASIMLEGHVNGAKGRRYMKKAAKSNPERTAYKNATDLSLARAKSVKRFLVENGVDPSRVSCAGKGGKERIYKHPNNQKENSANRRIEIFVL